MTNTLGIPLYHLKMLSEKMYKCMAAEAPNDNMTSKENIHTNANVPGGYACRMEAT